MDDEEELGQRIVWAIDALPVPPRPSRTAAAKAGAGWVRAVLPAVAAAIGAVVLLVVVPLVAQQQGATQSAKVFADDFTSGIDRGRWTVMGAGAGNSVTAVDGSVELALAADSRPGADGYWNATLWTQRCVARGDYEVSVDYRLLDWPPANGTRLVLGEFSPGTVTIGRRQIGALDYYDTSDDRGSASRATTDRQGSLRLVRRGTIVTAYHRGAADQPWTELSSQLTSRFDATFQIFLFSGGGDSFGGRTVRVAVDNFRLAAATLVCP